MSTPHPAFPSEQFDWGWIVQVKLLHKHSPPTKWFEAWIDSGSPWCLFHSGLCKSLGIKLDSGVKQQLGGIITGPSADMYFHKVKVMIGSEMFETMAGFCPSLTVAGILGRHGFFDNFGVTFDPSVHPPQIELNRLHKA